MEPAVEMITRESQRRNYLFAIKVFWSFGEDRSQDINSHGVVLIRARIFRL